ncbi:MAG: hypothetical protein HY296_00510 [Thaumarchaeota archaeon]|nr:hypothetical protein [Nitrososphaerota archaeon]
MAVERISSLSSVVGGDRSDAMMAGIIHAEIRREVPNFSLADAFSLQLARKLGGIVVTGDPDFKDVKEADFLE